METGFKESIEHWQENLERVRAKIKPWTGRCKLCEVHWKGNCHSCPIGIDTGLENCRGTPYAAIVKLCNMPTINWLALEFAVQDELNYLQYLAKEAHDDHD